MPIALTSGFAAGSGHPVGTALVAAAVPPDQRRVGIAITRAAINAGIVIGPPLGAVAVITFGEMLYKPTSPVFAAESAPEGMEGRYQSLYSGASMSGMVFSPPIAGLTFQYAPDLLWPLCCALALAAAAALALIARSPARVAVAESG